MFNGYFEKWDNFVEHDKNNLIPESRKARDTYKLIFSFKDFREFGMGFFQTI